MVRTARKSRRSGERAGNGGTKGAAAAVVEKESSGMPETEEKVTDMQEQAGTEDEPACNEAAAEQNSAESGADAAGVDEQKSQTDAGAADDERPDADSAEHKDERVPGDLDVLRGQVFSEELEQHAVEQMFQWMKEQESEKTRPDSAELSGAALLEAVHHGRHVAGLALFLYEALASRLNLDMHWARRLAQAALWHDLGFAESGRRRHHKRSMEIIENNHCLTLAFGLEESDRPLVALLARYHRRAWPSMKHRRFAALSEADRKALGGAAALLRIADALDFRHRGAVEELRVSVRRRLVVITCFGSESCRKECRRALKKGDYFEKLYGGRLEVFQGKEGDRDVR